MLRSIFAGISVVLLTIVCGAPAIFLSLLRPDQDWVLRFGRIWAKGIASAAGVRVEVRDIGNLPRDRSVILISNHQSNFDMIALLLAMPRPFRVVAKRALFHVPIFGWCLRLAGMIPIDREKHARAIQSLEKAAVRIKIGDPVLFFPEGTRSTDGRLLPFKKGAFVMALKAGVPIVPVSVSGGVRILPKGSIRIRPGSMVVRFGPEISLEGRTLERKDLLIRRVHEAVQEGLSRIEPEKNFRDRSGAGAGAAAPTR